MKKLKGVVGASESLPYGVYEEAKTRIKHQSLIQDYQELHKENEAMRNKLQTTKQKKLTLLAEVRYLRRKFECLVQNQTNRQQLYAQTQLQPQKNEVQSKNVKRGTGLHSRFANVDYNSKNRINNGKEAAPRPPVLRFQVSPNNTRFSRNVSPLRNHMPNFESNQKGRIYSGKEAGLRNQTPVLNLNEVATRKHVRVFDLNQISGEEEEFQAYSVPVKLEEPKNCFINGVMEEQQEEMKVSACRNLGNDTKRAGKRKISWQDQVALRV